MLEITSVLQTSLLLNQANIFLCCRKLRERPGVGRCALCRDLYGGLPWRGAKNCTNLPRGPWNERSTLVKFINYGEGAWQVLSSYAPISTNPAFCGKTTREITRKHQQEGLLRRKASFDTSNARYVRNHVAGAGHPIRRP